MLYKRVFPLLLLFIFISTASGAQQYESVRLQLKWTHQFQFAGYYAAQEKGFYKEVGLEVEIIPATPKYNPIENVINGSADFGIGASDLIRFRERGVPVVVLASIFQHSPLVLLSLKNDGIQSIHDLANSTIMLEKDSAEIIAYLINEGIDITKLKLIPHNFSVESLVDGKVAAMTAYSTTETFNIQESGFEYVLYSPRAVGIDFYSDNLFAMESFIDKNPSVVKRFRAASLKGWYYAMQNQEEIIQIIKHKYKSVLSLEHLRFEAKQMEALIQMNIIEIGHTNPNRWRHILNIYTELNMVKGDVDLNKFLYNADNKSQYEHLYPILAVTLLLLAIAILIALRFISLSRNLKASIKELISAKSELNMSENKYQLFIENNVSIIFSFDREGRFTFASPNITKNLGYPLNEVIGRTFDFIVHPDDLQYCLSVFNTIVTTGEAQKDIDYRVLHKDGNILWHTTSLSPLKDELGNFTVLIGIANDYTEVKKSHLALKESEAKYRLLTDLSGDMIVMHRNFEKYYVNPAVVETLGYTQSEFLEIGLLELVHPDDVIIVSKNITNDRVERCEKNYNSDFRLRHKLGNYIDFAAHIIGHQVNDSDFITVINLRNITRKVKDEREIRKLSTAVYQSQSTIVITDLTGNIEYVNPHFTKITGYTYEEAIGHNPKILNSDYHPKEFYTDMWSTLMSGNTWKGEIYNKRKDGTCYWEDATIAPVFDSKGEMINFVAIKNDVTQRKNIENAISEQNAQLHDLIETKNRFISILAHDLKNPFHTMMGLSELLKTNIKPENKDAIELANALNSTASNTYTLLDNMLQWAHSQKTSATPRFKRVNLLELTTECSTLLYENAHAKDVTIDLLIDKGIEVFVDADMIKTILRNLITNAIKFSFAKSSVTVRGIQLNGITEISVIDKGVGMSADVIESLFKLGATYTTEGTMGEKGTGFGLMICKELIEKHDGTIRVESQPNLGTTFTITLPKIKHL